MTYITKLYNLFKQNSYNHRRATELVFKHWNHRHKKLIYKQYNSIDKPNYLKNDKKKY